MCRLSTLLVFVCLAAIAAAQPTDPTRGVFVAGATGGAVDRSGLAGNAPVLRERLVRLDHELLQTARVDAGQHGAGMTVLRLNLFHDVVLDMVVSRTGPTPAGYWLSGRLDGHPLSSATLVVNRDAVVAGEVRVVGATYTIRAVGNGLHSIRHSDPELPPDDDALQVAASPDRATGGMRPIRAAASSARQAAQAPPREDGSRIDVLVVYTPAARAAEGGRQGIEALIDRYVADANQAYADSGVIQRLHLVAALPIAYRETESGPGLPGGLAGNVDLHRLVQPDDGHMDEVHDLRDHHAADIVTFIGRYDDDTGGIAAICREPRTGRRGCVPESWFAFNLLDNEAPSGAYVHELGHTMGLNHDRYAATKCPRCPLAPEQDLRKWEPYPYAFGYVNQRALEPGAPESSRWVTIMAYDQQCNDAGIRCSHLLRFSNPDQTYSHDPDAPGDPMGVPGSRPSPSVAGPADARRTLNRTRRIVANFRRAPCLRSGMHVRLQASNGQYVVAVGNGGGEVLADRHRPGPWGRFTVVDRNGGCVESGDVVSLRTSDGFYLRARQGGGSTLDATAPRATPWARFVVRRERSRRGTVRVRDTVSFQARSGHYVAAAQGGGGRVTADRPRVGSWGQFGITAIR